MRSVTKKGLIPFAILCAVLMLLTTAVQPVTATGSSILVKYEKEIDQAKTFSQKITDDNYLLSIGEKLTNNKVLNNILGQIKYVKTNEEFESLFGQYVNVLKKQPEFLQLKSYFERMSFSDIQNFKSFSTKLINNGEDRLLLNSLKSDYIKSDAVTDVLCSVKTTTYKATTYKATTYKATAYSLPTGGSGPDLATFSTTASRYVSTGSSSPCFSKFGGTISPSTGSNGNPDWVPWFPGKIVLSIILAIIHILSILLDNCSGTALGILLFLWMPGFSG